MSCEVTLLELTGNFRWRKWHIQDIVEDVAIQCHEKFLRDNVNTLRYILLDKEKKTSMEYINALQ